MNHQIRRLMIVVVAMFMALMCAATYIQFIAQPRYVADPRNTRTVYSNFGHDRGSIIVAGTPIAESKESKDAFKFQRIYRPGSAYAFITGYYSTAANTLTGIERVADDVLSGNAPSLLIQRIQHLITGKQLQGGAVELTINPKVQETAFKMLRGRRGAAVAIDPKTGAILALVSSPAFDPNVLANHNRKEAFAAYDALTANPEKPLDNRAFGGHNYSPGSAFKIVTAAAMISSGKFNKDTLVDAPDELELPDTTFKMRNNANEACGNGKVPLIYAFAKSCNTPFGKAALEIGEDALRQQAIAFGFGEEMNMPLKVTPSIFPDHMNQSQLAMSGIGQYDVRTTALQMASIAATIGNKGIRMKPFMIQRELNADLTVLSTTAPRELSVAVSPEVASQIKDMMVEVVKQGTGRLAAVGGIDVAGKTGTAQVGDTGKADGWFVGFAPAEDPKIAVAVIIEGDQEGNLIAYGGTKAAPIAAAMIRAVMSR